MHTVEELQKISESIKKLIDDRKLIITQINECYQIFTNIIKQVFDVTDIENLTISDTNVSFFILKKHDSFEEYYVCPIETFVSVETFKKFIDEKNKEKIAKEQLEIQLLAKELEEFERQTYEALKKKFEGT